MNFLIFITFITLIILLLVFHIYEKDDTSFSLTKREQNEIFAKYAKKLKNEKGN